MAKNKIVYAGETLIDLTQDTVEPSVLKRGYTAHNKSGLVITGTLQFPNVTIDGAIATEDYNFITLNIKYLSLKYPPYKFYDKPFIYNNKICVSPHNNYEIYSYDDLSDNWILVLNKSRIFAWSSFTGSINNIIINIGADYYESNVYIYIWEGSSWRVAEEIDYREFGISGAFFANYNNELYLIGIQDETTPITSRNIYKYNGSSFVKITEISNSYNCAIEFNGMLCLFSYNTMAMFDGSEIVNQYSAPRSFAAAMVINNELHAFGSGIEYKWEGDGTWTYIGDLGTYLNSSIMHNGINHGFYTNEKTHVDVYPTLYRRVE